MAYEKQKPGKKRSTKHNPEDDARGQSESNHKGGSNDGVSSADPRVLSGKQSGDATFPIKKPREP